MSKAEKQRDILFEACKKIATNKRTPDWISGALTQAVMAAKAVQDDIWDEGLNSIIEPKVQLPPAIGKLAHIDMLDNLPYKIKLLSESEEVEGVRLWHVQIVEGTGPHKVGAIVYNVPETWIHDVEA